VYHTYEDKFESWGGICGIDGYVDIRNTGVYFVGAGNAGYNALSGNINKLTPMSDSVFFRGLDASISGMREKKTKRESKKIYEAEEQDALVELLEDFGFTDVAFKWKNSPYNFNCDQVGGGVVCPCCYGVHDDNNFFFKVVDGMEINMKNNSESCESRVMDSYKVMKYLFDCLSVSGRRLTSVSRQRTRGKQDQKSV